MHKTTHTLYRALHLQYITWIALKNNFFGDISQLFFFLSWRFKSRQFQILKRVWPLKMTKIRSKPFGLPSAPRSTDTYFNWPLVVLGVVKQVLQEVEKETSLPAPQEPFLLPQSSAPQVLFLIPIPAQAHETILPVPPLYHCYNSQMHFMQLFNCFLLMAFS